MKEGGFEKQNPATSDKREKIPSPANDNIPEHLPPKNLKEWMNGLWLAADKELTLRRTNGSTFDQDQINTWEYHAANLMESELVSEIEELTLASCKADPAHCTALLKEFARRQNKAA